MNATVIVLLVEMAVVLCAIVALLVFFRWKSRRAKATELEKLLDDFSSKEADRKASLITFFNEKQGLAVEQASESTDYLLEAEKQFLQGFLKQQMERTSLESFYEGLSGLLDQYLYFIPEKVTESESSSVTESDGE